MRIQQDEAGQLIAPSAAWQSSAKSADEKIRQDQAASRKLKFRDDVYGSESVRAPLDKLFRGKCAYCESPVERPDVEHFRPKGRVAEDPQHPGYYWLAYTWENLFPSCAACNQNRKDQPTWDDPTLGPSAGKLDQFPLEDGTSRAMTPDSDIGNERPLLLNPCLDQPADHFSCNFHTGELIPKNNSPRADKTIEVMNLNRKRLRDKRKMVGRNLKALLENLLAQNIDPAPALAAAFISESHPYAGFARTLVSDPGLMDMDFPGPA